MTYLSTGTISFGTILYFQAFNPMPPHDFIKGKGGPDIRWPIWNLGKRISLNVQAHLSALLALAIVGMMIVREFAELRDLFREPRWLLFVAVIVGLCFTARYMWLLWVPVKLRRRVHLLYGLITLATFAGLTIFARQLVALYNTGHFRLVILTLAIATISAALWEVFGDKLSSSHRDIWFSVAMREAVRQFHEIHTRAGKMSEAELVDWYGNFLDWVLKYSSTALCGRNKVHAGFLVRPPDREGVLRLVKASEGSGYPQGLEVLLPAGEQTGGAAGQAFVLNKPGVVSVPYRKEGTAWTHFWTPDLTYYMSEHSVRAWTEVEGQPWFESSLSVPVYFYDKEHRTTARLAGILAFSTQAPDPFEPPDFLMAECFAHLISEALLLRETMRGSPQNSTEGPLHAASPQRRKKTR